MERYNAIADRHFVTSPAKQCVAPESLHAADISPVWPTQSSNDHQETLLRTRTVTVSSIQASTMEQGFFVEWFVFSGL
jgi:hypothetical protein